MLEPSQTVQRRLTLWQTLATLNWLFKQYRWRTTVIIALLILAGLAEGFGILSILPLIGVLLGKDDTQQGEFERAILDVMDRIGVQPEIGVLLCGVVFAMVLKGGLTILAMSQVGYGGARLAADLRTKFTQALMNARWSYFVEQPAGHVANTMNVEATRGANAYLSACNIFVNFIQVLIFASISMLVSVQASVGALTLGLAMFLILRRIIHKTRSAAIVERESLRKLMVRLIDGLTLIKPLKAMALEQSLTPALAHETARLKMAQQRRVLYGATMGAVQEPFLAIFLAVGVYIAVTFTDMTLAQLLFLAIIAQRIFARMGNLQTQFQALSSDEPALTFIRSEIASAEKAVEARQGFDGQLVPNYTREICLQDVSFTYGDRTTIDNLSLTIPKGKFVAIIGPSGAGKTTIVDLITGLLQPNDGKIMIDDEALSELDMRLWRGSIGYVPQETFLFHNTISNNISLGSHRYKEKEVEWALDAAGAMEFVSERSEGINDIVGERGGKLSGGQRQRISLARALIRKPSLLILDEPTSGLDSKTETAILETLQKLADPMTILVISHQPAVIRAARLVYRLEHGRVVETIENK